MNLTALLVTTGLIALAVYDGIVVYLIPMLRDGKPCVDRSVSRFMQKMPTRSPFVIFVMGYVAGHFWGFFPCPECPEPVPEIQTEPDNLGPPVPVLRKRVEKWARCGSGSGLFGAGSSGSATDLRPTSRASKDWKMILWQ